MDRKKEIKECVEMFLQKDTDYFPELPCTEYEFMRWSSIYIGVKSISSRVRNKIKKMGLIKGE